jgi:hypothetical protein
MRLRNYLGWFLRSETRMQENVLKHCNLSPVLQENRAQMGKIDGGKTLYLRQDERTWGNYRQRWGALTARTTPLSRESPDRRDAVLGVLKGSKMGGKMSVE